MSLRFIRTNSHHPDFIGLVKALDAELALLYGADQIAYDRLNVLPFLETVLMAYQHDVAIGCGCIKALSTEVTELKRMYVAPNVRKSGIGGQLVKGLLDWAKDLGYPHVWLQTGHLQPDAERLYERMGFERMPPYPPYENDPHSRCFKRLSI